jgi:monovalent cation/hydrogen antiporter
MIRVLGLANAGDRESQTDRAEELQARRDAIDAALERLAELVVKPGLDAEVVPRLREELRNRVRHFEQAPERDEDHRDLTACPDEIHLLLIAAERERINELYRKGKLKDEARRRLERELDLREANLESHQH